MNQAVKGLFVGILIGVLVGAVPLGHWRSQTWPLIRPQDGLMRVAFDLSLAQ